MMPAPDQQLSQLPIESLIAAGTGDELLAALAAVLGPQTRLWLIDAAAGIAYVGDGSAADRAIDSFTGCTVHPCRHGDDLIAVIESTHPAAAWVGRILAPLLVHMQVRETTWGRLRLAEEQARLFITAGGLLQEFDLEAVLVKSLETALTAVRADTGALLLAEAPVAKGAPAAQVSLATRVAWGLRDDHLAALVRRDGVSLTASAVVDGATIHYSGDDLRAVLPLGALADVAVQNLLIVPLVIGGRGLGAVVLVNGATASQDRALAEAACRLAAIAVDNARHIEANLERERMDAELAVAHRVQQRIFPTGPLSVGNLMVTGRSLPCDETGGDYYHYALRGPRLAVFLGDVSGHGISAALYTTMVHAGLQQALRSHAADVQAIAELLNDGLEASSLDETFMTAVLMEIDPETGIFAWTSAGHEAVLHVHADGRLDHLDSQGMALGMMPGSTYPSVTGRLEAGDRLVVITDGITECWNADRSDQFGTQRVEAAVIAHRDRSGDDLLAALLDEVAAWAAGSPYLDDVTAVVVARAAQP